MDCHRRVLVSILSVIIIGLTLISQIANAVSAKESVSLNEAGNWNFILQLIVTIVIGLILVFAIYTSIWGNFCCKILLSILYIIVDLVILAMMLFLFTVPSLMKDKIKDSWLDPNRLDKILKNEEELKCCGYENPAKEGRTCTIKITCKDKVNKAVTTYSITIGVIMLIMFIALTTCIVFLIIDAKADKKEKDESQHDTRFITPFAYGWGV